MSHDTDTLTGLLQALEHTAEMIDRLSTVLERFIQAQQQGEVIDPAVVAEYAAQLETVRGQRARLRERITQWWVLIGREGAQ